MTTAEDPPPGTEIEIVADGDGLALIGDATAIDRFLGAHNVPAREMEVRRVSKAATTASAVATTGSQIAESSGRWIKLTEKSAQALKVSDTMTGSAPGVSRAVLTHNGKVSGILEFATTSGRTLANPAVLTGVSGLMAQMAMQQAMDEITDYLKVFDAKVDDVLRAQKDAVLADMIGVGVQLEEAVLVRDQVGRMPEINWSKVQAAPGAIARTQAHALRQLDAKAEKLERAKTVGDIAKATRDVERDVEEWLAVLARCFQLQDALGVLELDRALDAAPEELDDHRTALRAARSARLATIGRATERVVERIGAAAGVANAKVLLHPTAARTVVASGNEVTSAVAGLHEVLGIGLAGDGVEARRWSAAATDVRDRALETGARGVSAAREVGSTQAGRARAAGGKVAAEVAERARKRREGGE
ncbi:hypothetical protein [Demequina sp. NBRC 110056]|uniref:hypothetical protein n=1 Tax=Demequina sp. NBRC 110056 TaxID=1570345 RepID=UPI000A0747A7|nr:hypothetical protein [Demequina sp. NBRC 110056]